MLFFSTLNRTPQSFLKGIVAAEYILRWVPQGTHDWTKFIRPEEMVHALEEEGIETLDVSGISYDLLCDRFNLSQELDMNYIMMAQKAETRSETQPVQRHE
mmetsp:Transcript_6296/g.15332  ORF Transcript_6296/g.15332 Transcript_6296/m.15332 type:complete len:101 (+) Transcript_6296:224-526(+)